MRILDYCPSPQFIVWDITYACPLRCVHCYSESGRRASRQLGADDLRRVTDALISMQPRAVVLSGGEPLAVKEIFEVAERMSKAGVGVLLYTSGWSLDLEMLPAIMSLFSRVNVSIDGADALTHDRIRGRSGSFDRAMRALGLLDGAIGARRRCGEMFPVLGIDFVAMQSNFQQAGEVCTRIAPQFPELRCISFGAVLPTGLGNRAEFVELEMLSDEQAALLGDGQLARELQTLSPAWVEVSTSDNRMFLMHPELMASGMDIPPLQIEPDGMVRAMPIYEGTVGSLLTESPSALWERAIDRWSHPFVLETLTPARTVKAWAEAARRLDEHFGSEDDRSRIARRPVYRRD